MEINGVVLPEPDPEMLASFEQMDELMSGLNPEQARDFARNCYVDGIGRLRARAQLRVVDAGEVDDAGREDDRHPNP